MQPKDFMLEREELYLNSIMLVVVSVTGVRDTAIRSKSRNTPELVLARQVYCYVAYMHRPFNISLATIGAFINKDHSTVIYNKNRAGQLLSIKDSLITEKIKQFNSAYDGSTLVRIPEGEYIRLLKKEELLNKLIKGVRLTVREIHSELNKLAEI